MLLTFYAKYFFSAQPDFLSQKCKIEESITISAEEKYHLEIYYPKYHYALNHFEHFWYNAQK